jgi:putative transposase
MPFWKCYYHIIWATKHREPIIVPAYEQVIFAAIEQTTLELKCNILAVNCVEDHIHVAASIKPSISVAKYVGRIKGSASRAVNTSFEQETRFHWQEGYSVLSFGEKALPFVQGYIAKQKQHHAGNDVNYYLERIED